MRDQAGNLLVRAAQPADVEAIVELSGKVQDALTASGSPQQIGPIPANVAATHIAAGTAYVLDRKGDIIGSLFMEPVTEAPISPRLRSHLQSWQFDLKQPHWFLQKFMVSPDARGDGLGRRLLDSVVGRIAEHGGGTVVLDCWVGNTRLRRYYRDAGFSLQCEFTEGEFEVAVFYRGIPSPAPAHRGVTGERST